MPAVSARFIKREFRIIHEHIEVGSLLGKGGTANGKTETALVGNVDYLSEIVRENAVADSFVHAVENVICLVKS